MKYDFFANKNIECCSQCSMNKKTYPKKENSCLCYKDKNTETTLNGFPEHCQLRDILCYNGVYIKLLKSDLKYLLSIPLANYSYTSKGEHYLNYDMQTIEDLAKGYYELAKGLGMNLEDEYNLNSYDFVNIVRRYAKFCFQSSTTNLDGEDLEYNFVDNFVNNFFKVFTKGVRNE